MYRRGIGISRLLILLATVLCSHLVRGGSRRRRRISKREPAAEQGVLAEGSR
jgi:hypothetical protein